MNGFRQASVFGGGLFFPLLRRWELGDPMAECTALWRSVLTFVIVFRLSSHQEALL